MYIVVVTVYEIYALIAGQIIEGLLGSKPIFLSEFIYENQSPLYFICITIHSTYTLMLAKGTKKMDTKHIFNT